MLEPDKNSNPRFMVDPPGWLRHLFRRRIDGIISPDRRKKIRARAEAKRVREGKPHIVEYFHQLDDPYSYLAAQTIRSLAERYDIEIRPHLIHATGGKDQPELEKLAVWARRDAALIAPHYQLSIEADAPVAPDIDLQEKAARYLGTLSREEFISNLADVTEALWAGRSVSIPAIGGASTVSKAILDAGSSRLKKLGHYSGATFYYAGEWYWGVDRLFYLEERLRGLGAARTEISEFIAPRPAIDIGSVDASAMRLHFYPSLNSPYTSIIYDKVIELKDACKIQFHHKPVLPMIMRGVPATRAKGDYIVFDTKREAETLGVPFGPMITPIGEPVRRAYSLLPWAAQQAKDEALLSALLKCAFSAGVALHSEKGMRRGIEMAGLNWREAKKIIGDDAWKPIVENHQDEMVEELGLWGVPSFRLEGPDGEPDLAVWGQDRLWLIAAEIKRRAQTRD